MTMWKRDIALTISTMIDPSCNFGELDPDELRAKSLKWQLSGSDAIAMNVADSDYSPGAKFFEEWLEEVSKIAKEEKYTYHDLRGMPEVRESVYEKLKSVNNIYLDSPDQVYVTVGTMMGIFGCCYHTLKWEKDKGRGEAILQDPVYPPFQHNVRFVGGKVVWLPQPHEQGFSLDFDLLQDLITKDTRLLMFCNPHNPVGRVYTKEELHGIRDVVLDHGNEDLIVMSDELYETLVFDDRKHISLASLPDMMERTVTLFGYSKGQALAGLRLAYLAIPPEFAKMEEDGLHPKEGGFLSRLSAVQVHAPLPLQLGLKVAIKSQALQDYATGLKDQCQKMRDIMVPTLNEMPRVSCFNPEGAMFVFPHFESWDSEILQERLHKKAGICGVAGVNSGPTGEGHIRLTLATSEGLVRESLNRIENFIKNNKP